MTYDILDRLVKVIKDRKANPRPDSYVCHLLKEGVPLTSRKVGEEAVELAISAMEGDRRKIAGEAADLIFHTLVMLESVEVSLEEVWAELENRFGKTGLKNK